MWTARIEVVKFYIGYLSSIEDNTWILLLWSPSDS